MTTSTSAKPFQLLSNIVTYPEEDPKRVILRLRVNEFEGKGNSWEEHLDAIQTYFILAERSTNEYEGDHRIRRQSAHVELFQALELRQTTFHVILDVKQLWISAANFNLLPHEVYQVGRNRQGQLKGMAIDLDAIILDPHRAIRKFNISLVAANVINKTCIFTDILYPWAGRCVHISGYGSLTQTWIWMALVRLTHEELNRRCPLLLSIYDMKQSGFLEACTSGTHHLKMARPNACRGLVAPVKRLTN